MENKDQPAFPGTYQDKDNQFCVSDCLTKREYFAGLAMQGFLANPTIALPLYENSDLKTIIAEGSVKMADALLSSLTTQQ